MPDGITNLSTYNIIINASGFEILDVKTEQTFNFKEHSTYSIDHDLPFNLKLDRTIPFEDINGKTFIVNFNSIKNATLNLKRLLEVEPIGEQSDLLKVSIKGESTELTEAIINSLVEIFNQDGISDRRLVSKRTLEFIDDRFEFLALGTSLSMLINTNLQAFFLSRILNLKWSFFLNAKILKIHIAGAVCLICTKTLALEFFIYDLGFFLKLYRFCCIRLTGALSYFVVLAILGELSMIKKVIKRK